MLIPGVHLETIRPPQQYSVRQLDIACQLAQILNRGKLVLAVEPEGEQ